MAKAKPGFLSLFSRNMGFPRITSGTGEGDHLHQPFIHSPMGYLESPFHLHMLVFGWWKKVTAFYGVLSGHWPLGILGSFSTHLWTFLTFTSFFFFFKEKCILFKDFNARQTLTECFTMLWLLCKSARWQQIKNIISIWCKVDFVALQGITSDILKENSFSLMHVSIEHDKVRYWTLPYIESHSLCQQ